jgi:hypothetical protein
VSFELPSLKVGKRLQPWQAATFMAMQVECFLTHKGFGSSLPDIQQTLVCALAYYSLLCQCEVMAMEEGSMWVENGFLQVSVVQTKTAATADFIIESIGFLLSFFLCSLSSDILDTDLVKLYKEYFKQRKQARVESKRLWL